MFYHDIRKDDMLNGPGLRVVLFVSGCNHYCKGCQNPQTWDPRSGIKFGAKDKEEIMEALTEPHCAGLTLCGGDPLYHTNIPTLYKLVKEVKERFPSKTIVMYTGDLWENVKDFPIVKMCDILIDGEFQQELADVNYPWAGSTNQRVIDVKASEGKLEPVLVKTEYAKTDYEWDENLRRCIACSK